MQSHYGLSPFFLPAPPPHCHASPHVLGKHPTLSPCAATPNPSPLSMQLYSSAHSMIREVILFHQFPHPWLRSPYPSLFPFLRPRAAPSAPPSPSLSSPIHTHMGQLCVQPVSRTAFPLTLTLVSHLLLPIAPEPTSSSDRARPRRRSPLLTPSPPVWPAPCKASVSLRDPDERAPKAVADIVFRSRRYVVSIQTGMEGKRSSVTRQPTEGRRTSRPGRPRDGGPKP